MGIFIICTGLALASFIGSLSYRSHRNISIVTPPSFCPDCGSSLRIPDLIPVLSYILLRGRCRYCGKSIPVRYPAAEIVLPCVLFFLYRHHGITPLFFCYGYLSCVLLYLALLDLEVGSIRVWEGLTVYAGSAAYLLLVIRGTVPVPLPVPLYGLAVGVGLAAVSIGAVFIIKKRMGLGVGDLLVLPGVSLYFGPEEIIRVLICASVLGLIAGFVLLIIKRKSAGGMKLPFLPCLAGGVFIEILFF